MVTTQSSLLIRLRSKEDSEAWSRFVRIYTPLIDHWINRLGIESNQVNDLVQEVFATLLGRVSMLSKNPPNSFRAWLRTVTLNKCCDFFRRSKKTNDCELLDQIEIAEKDPASILTEDEYRKFVAQSALHLMRDAFSENTWRACWEHVACGKPAIEVAELLGISVNAVYLARGRVLKRLRSELEGLWD